jgi:hypothetical protein
MAPQFIAWGLPGPAESPPGLAGINDIRTRAAGRRTAAPPAGRRETVEQDARAEPVIRLRVGDVDAGQVLARRG